MKTTAAPEKKSVKTLKGQLFGALSMMLVASIALGTSTYAWFINNRTAAVENMELTVSAAQTLQIAVKRNSSTAENAGYDGTKSKYTDYKNLILKTDISAVTEAGGITGGAGWTHMFSTDAQYLLTPASVAATSLASAAPAFYKSDNHVTGDSKLDSFTSVTHLGQGEVKVFPLSFLSSSDTNVYFGQDGLTSIADIITAVQSTNADPTAKDKEQEILDAQAAAIKGALRLAIVPKVASENKPTGVTDPYTASNAIIFQFDAGAPVFVPGSANNTDYSHVTSYTKTWDETKGLYDAIHTVNATGTTVGGTTIYPITKIENVQVQVPGLTGNNANDYRAAVTVSGNDVGVVAGTTPLFALSGGIPRDVLVYMWLEGTDQDVVSAMSSYKFNINLPFAAATATPSP